jgi:hypothetical protein
MTRRRAILAIPSSAAIAALAVTQTGCPGDAIIADLQAGLDLIAGFLPQLGSLVGLPADLASLVQDYAASVNTALGNASTILLGGGTDAEKAALILASLAGIAAPLIPPPFSVAVGIVAGLAAAVAKFLASLPAPTSAGIATPATLGNSAAALGHTTHVWSGRQQTRLQTAHATANSNATALAKIRGK